MFDTLLSAAGVMIPVVVLILLIVTLGFVASRMYKKTTPETSMVRTGAGGRTVITNGGAFVIGLIHNVTLVNMKTLGLEIKRNNDDALITKDRMRVDVGAKFYVRVKPNDNEFITAAATTLGARTFNAQELREMVEDKLVDALRSVAATMTMDELHENRSKFVQDVQNALNEDLAKNGLELESVSLTTMDQTPFENLDENNAFNAVGMRKLAEVIAKSKEERAQIDADVTVKVAQSEKGAELKRLEIRRETEEARIQQEQAVAEAESRSSAEKAKAEELASQERERARITREEAIQVADQERQIAVNVKSMEESEAKAKADEARAKARTAEEAVTTAGQVAAADRAKRIAIIAAEESAERDATGIRVAASAKKEAALDEAEAIQTKATAEAMASESRAKGITAIALAEAEGRKAMIDAENLLSADLIDMKIDMARIEALPSIVAEMVRPAEMIDRITVHNVTGLGNGSSGNGSSVPVAGGAAGGVVDALMGMALQLPALSALGKEAGVNISDGLSGILEGTVAPTVSDAGGDTELTFEEAAALGDAIPSTTL